MRSGVRKQAEDKGQTPATRTALQRGAFPLRQNTDYLLSPGVGRDWGGKCPRCLNGEWSQRPGKTLAAAIRGGDLKCSVVAHFQTSS